MSVVSDDGFDLRDPSWFLHDLDPGAGQARFLRAARDEISAAPFLDHRWHEAGEARAEIPLTALTAIEGEPSPLSFVWHTAFCGSTLLASCLDSPGGCLALKEPRALSILAGIKRGGGLRDPGLARGVLALLARRFQPGEQVLVKPSNTANGLIPDAAALTRGPMLLLHSDCESFVLSIAARGEAGFAYVREAYVNRAADGHPAGRWPAEQVLKLTDLKMAALVWRMQMDVLEAASARLGERARSLDSRRFLEDPRPVLRALEGFLGLGLGADRIDEVVDGPLFGRDAKQPDRRFDAGEAAESRRRLRARLGRDLDEVLASVEQAFPRAPQLAAPLMTPSRQDDRGDALQGCPAI